MTPDQLLPASSAGASALLLVAAFVLGYLAQHARTCLRTAFYAAASAASTLAAAGLLFGNLLAASLPR